MRMPCAHVVEAVLASKIRILVVARRPVKERRQRERRGRRREMVSRELERSQSRVEWPKRRSTWLSSRTVVPGVSETDKGCRNGPEAVRRLVMRVVRLRGEDHSER